MASSIKLVNVTTGEVLTQDVASKHIHMMSQENTVDTLRWTCCANCRKFDPAHDVCGRWKARPPAKVMAIGCLEWEPDLPF